MPAINVAVSDELDRRFRLEIVKRKGGRKGDVGEAVGEALELWIASEPVGKVASIVMNKDSSYSLREKGLEALGKMGWPAFGALTDIVNDGNLSYSMRTKAQGYLDALVTAKARAEELSAAEQFLLRHGGADAKARVARETEGA